MSSGTYFRWTWYWYINFIVRTQLFLQGPTLYPCRTTTCWSSWSWRSWIEVIYQGVLTTFRVDLESLGQQVWVTFFFFFNLKKLKFYKKLFCHQKLVGKVAHFFLAAFVFTFVFNREGKSHKKEKHNFSKVFSFHSENIFWKKLQFRSILLPYKNCVTEKRLNICKQRVQPSKSPFTIYISCSHVILIVIGEVSIFLIGTGLSNF